MEWSHAGLVRVAPILIAVASVGTYRLPSELGVTVELKTVMMVFFPH
jgi:hypothetical protein